MSKAKGKPAKAIIPTLVFDQFQSVAQFVDTVILLLRSAETALNLHALSHLDRYASKCIANYSVLHEHQLLAAIYPHLLSDHRFVRRFALKLLSQIFAVPLARSELFAEPLVHERARTNYIEPEDTFLNEYSAQVLSCLADDGAAHLSALAADEELHRHLMRRLVATNDPDVLHRTLELLGKISGTPDGLQVLCESTDFPFAFTLATTKSDYPQVQREALQLLRNLASCSGAQFTERFADPLFMTEMFGILENFLWHDLHEATIGLLQCTVRRADMAERFRDDSLPRFMGYVEATLHHRLTAMRVLVQLAEHASARQSLWAVGFADYLLEYLAAGQVPWIVHGVAEMAGLPVAMEKFVAERTVEQLFGLLAGRDVSGADRAEVAGCLARLLACSKEMCVQSVECGGMSVVAELLRRNRGSGMQVRRPLVEMLNTLAKQRALRGRVMTDAMARGVYFAFRTSKSHPELTVEILKALANYVSEDPISDQLLLMDSHLHLLDCLQATASRVRDAAVQFLLASSKYPELTDMFIDRKVLDCLLAEAALRSPDCPGWSAAIEAILANNLPVKWALRGRLDLRDRTQDDFYATKKIWHHYRRLRQLFIHGCAARKPIFLCNFHNTRRSASIVTLASRRETRCPGSGSIVEQESTSLSEQFNVRPADQNLAEYLRIVREALQIQRIPANLQRIADYRQCVEIIADVVCSKICSLPASVSSGQRSLKRTESLLSVDSYLDGKPATAASVELAVEAHLEALKMTEYDCNIIPLGAIVVGAHFEKSLLFKVLADQVGLPCALHMDATNNRMVWNEVALPVYEDLPEACGRLRAVGQGAAMAEAEATGTSSTTTHIVDLMESPGRMYLIGCKRALQYLGKAGVEK